MSKVPYNKPVLSYIGQLRNKLMGNIATNTITQIQTLTDRGMDLDYNEDKTKAFLLDIGYYRLGFYWNPFEIDGNHNFKPGTKFSDVIKLYYLVFTK